MDDEEQRHIIEALGDDITPEEMIFVQNETTAPVDVEALVRDISPGLEAQMYLALDAVTANHDQLKLPRLYS